MEIDIRSRSARFEIAAGTDLLRVMISKSLNLNLQRHGAAARSLCLRNSARPCRSGAAVRRPWLRSRRDRRRTCSRHRPISNAGRPDFAVIGASRDPVVGAGLAEVGLHELQRLVADVQTGLETERVHLRARGRPDAVEFADGQRLDELRPQLRRRCSPWTPAPCRCRRAPECPRRP